MGHRGSRSSPRRRARWTARQARGLALALLGLAAPLPLIGCGPEPTLVVTLRLGALPEAPAEVEPVVSQEGRPAAPLERLPLGGASATPTFALRLSGAGGGAVVVGAGAYDRRGCLTGVGLGEGEAQDGGRIEVRLDALPQPECQGRRPLLIAASPAAAPTGEGGQRVAVRGFGLQPGATARLGDLDAPLTWRSGAEVLVEVPPHAGIAQLPVRVQNPGGAAAEIPFRYYSEAPEFAQALYPLQLGTEVLAAEAGLFDGNPLPDLAGVSQREDGGRTIYDLVLLLNSRFTQTLDPELAFYQLQRRPRTLAVGDLNQDARQDVVIAYEGSDVLSLVLNQGRTFWKNDVVDSELAKADLSVGGQPAALGVADLNGDGRADLVVGNAQSKTVDVLLGEGGGAFRPRSSYPLDAAPAALRLGDLSGDGRPDVVVVYDGAGAGSLDILVNDGAGAFPAARYRQSRVGQGPLRSPTLLDIDGDGTLDLAFLSEGEDRLHVWRNRGGRLDDLLRAEYGTGRGPRALEAGDVDGDGEIDLAVAQADGALTLLLNEGRDPARRGLLRAHETRLPTGQGGLRVILVDADKDGATDVGLITPTVVYVFSNRSK